VTDERTEAGHAEETERVEVIEDDAGEATDGVRAEAEPGTGAEPADDPAISREGEPVFSLGIVELSPTFRVVGMQIALNGATISIAIRPEVAISLAGGLQQIGTRARSPIEVAGADAIQRLRRAAGNGQN
jgi:hypothetical protein